LIHPVIYLAIYLFVHLLTDLFSDWSIDSSIHRLIDWLAGWLQRCSGRRWVNIVSRTMVHWCCRHHTLARWLSSCQPCWPPSIHYRAVAALLTGSSSVSLTPSLISSHLLPQQLPCQT